MLKKSDIRTEISVHNANAMIDACHRAMFARWQAIGARDNAAYEKANKEAREKFSRLMNKVYGHDAAELDFECVNALMTTSVKNTLKFRPRHMLPKAIAAAAQVDVTCKLSAPINETQKKESKAAAATRRDKAYNAFFEARRKAEALKERCDRGELDIASYQAQVTALYSTVDMGIID